MSGRVSTTPTRVHFPFRGVKRGQGNRREDRRWVEVGRDGNFGPSSVEGRGLGRESLELNKSP